MPLLCRLLSFPVGVAALSPKPWSSWVEMTVMGSNKQLLPGSIESIHLLYTFTCKFLTGSWRSKFKNERCWTALEEGWEPQQERESTGEDRYRKSMTRQNLSLYFTFSEKTQFISQKKWNTKEREGRVSLCSPVCRLESAMCNKWSNETVQLQIN